MEHPSDLPLIEDLPRARLPTAEPLILASGSPRRAQLLRAAGYQFTVQTASDDAESGTKPDESPRELVIRFARQKAADVAGRVDQGLILAADTIADLDGQVIGKPRDRADAEGILQRLSGRRHLVHTGVCLWSCLSGRYLVDVTSTELEMQALAVSQLQQYLDSGRWAGKAGAFGYQDGNDWLHVLDGGSESNVVGLPMERLAELLEKFVRLAETVPRGTESPS